MIMTEKEKMSRMQQAWYNFWNPEMPTLEELRWVRKLFHGLCILMVFCIIGSLVAGRIELGAGLVLVLLVCIPLFEWRVKVNIRELEEGQCVEE